MENVLPRAKPLRAAIEVHLVVRAEHAEAILGAGLPAGATLHFAPPLSEGRAPCSRCATSSTTTRRS